MICLFDLFFFFKQKTAYEMRISDWSSDVCSSDLGRNKRMTRAEAYAWMASTLAIPPEQAHIGMLNERQCEALILAVKNYKHVVQHATHWKQKTRKQIGRASCRERVCQYV